MVVQDLTPLHDATRVLINPDKGWYHHFPDNHPNKYKIARDADLLEFPGMDHSISYRDDSILVNGYLQGTSDNFTVRSPEFFADAYLRTATVFELEHYGAVKGPGNWDARPDSSVAKYGKGKNGPDYFRCEDA